jgi:hypothetical protein
MLQSKRTQYKFPYQETQGTKTGGPKMTQSDKIAMAKAIIDSTENIYSPQANDLFDSALNELSTLLPTKEFVAYCDELLTRWE